MYYIKPSEETAEGIIDSATDIDNLNSKFKNMRAELQDPRSTAGRLIHVNPDENLLLQLAETPRLNDIITVIDYSDQLPEIFKINNVYEKMQEFLTSVEFDTTNNSICIISPFIGLYRGFTIEIFNLADGLKVIAELTSDGKVGIDSYINEVDSAEIKEVSVPNFIDDSEKVVESKDKNSIALTETIF